VVFVDDSGRPSWASRARNRHGVLLGMLLDEAKVPSLDAHCVRLIDKWCTGDKNRFHMKHL